MNSTDLTKDLLTKTLGELKLATTLTRDFLSAFPRRHAFIASSLLLLLTCAATLTPSLTPPDSTKPTPNATGFDIALSTVTLTKPGVVADRQTPDQLATTDPTSLQKQNKTIQVEPPISWQELEVRNGDSLSIIFKRVGLSAAELHNVVHNSKEGKSLAKIYPGHKLAFQIDKNAKLQALRHAESKIKSTLYHRTEEGYEAEVTIREPIIHNSFRHAVINNSLFLAGQKVGLPQGIIMELANIFGGVIDFVYDPRKGDSFNLIFEEKFLDGEKIGNGAIVAAQYINQGEAFTAYRYKYENGDVGYFNEKGISMRKAFLRAPLDFTRISSGFNLRRKHPIHKKIKAHRGVDYAAPRGTPIFAAGDGRIVTSGYSKANGKYVVIKHGPQYTTKYLHLNKRTVKRGQKIKQRQIIGYVGSTGYATGPHLHYEFLVNGVHRNPRTILKKLPKAKSIGKQELTRFSTQTNNLKLQLARHEQTINLASLDTEKITTPSDH